MKKRLAAYFCATVLVCAIGSTQVYAAAEAAFRGKMLEERTEGIPDRDNGFHRELTDEQKTQLEDARTQREEKLNAFVNSLSSEQKALYEAMLPAQPSEGQQRAKPDNAAMEEMKNKQEAFAASLSESQKTAYEELFTRPHGIELSDEQKSQMEDARKQREEKLNAFINSLDSNQKALYEAMTPTKPTEDQRSAKPDSAVMEDMKNKREAFISSLSEAQKTEYDELFAKQFHSFGNPDDSTGTDIGAMRSKLNKNETFSARTKPMSSLNV